MLYEVITPLRQAVVEDPGDALGLGGGLGLGLDQGREGDEVALVEAVAPQDPLEVALPARLELVPGARELGGRAPDGVPNGRVSYNFV